MSGKIDGYDFGLITDKTIVYNESCYGIHYGILSWLRSSLKLVGSFRFVKCQMYQQVNDFCKENGYTEENPPLCTCIAHREVYSSGRAYDVVDIYGLNGIDDGFFRFSCYGYISDKGFSGYTGYDVAEFRPYRQESTFGRLSIHDINTIVSSVKYQFGCIPPGIYPIVIYAQSGIDIINGTLRIVDIVGSSRRLTIELEEYMPSAKYTAVINKNALMTDSIVFRRDISADSDETYFGTYTPDELDSTSPPYITSDPSSSPVSFTISNCNSVPKQIIILPPQDDVYSTPTILYPHLGRGLSFSTSAGTGQDVFPILVSATFTSSSNGNSITIRMSSTDSSTDLDALCYQAGREYRYQLLF